MFKKKYIFETKRTKTKRYLKNLLIVLIILFILYIAFCFYIIIYAKNENKLAKETFYKKAPDLISIFTGDGGRISYGLNKALEHQNTQIFITGVYTSNSIKTLLYTQNKSLLNKFNLYKNLIEVDYLATNTVENVISTLRYLKKNKNIYKDVLIISSDYHILRISMITNFINNSPQNYHFYFMGIRTNFTNWRNIKIIVKEVIKVSKTFAFLLLWEKEDQKSK